MTVADGILDEAMRVYIVGHTPIIRRLLVTAIESAGARLVGTSDNAQQAIRDLLGLQPDLILFAIVLRSGTGFDVLQALQADSNSAPAAKVVLTNQTTAEDRDNSFRLGATHFFDKTYESWRVFELVETMAADWRRRNGRSE